MRDSQQHLRQYQRTVLQEVCCLSQESNLRLQETKAGKEGASQSASFSPETLRGVPAAISLLPGSCPSCWVSAGSQLQGPWPLIVPAGESYCCHSLFAELPVACSCK